MAVQDGYGKSSGSESLSYAFDLKDTTNSFRGEPATNIWLSGNPSPHGSGIQIIQTNYFLGKIIDSGVVYRNYVTNPAQSDTGTYYNNAGLNIGSMSFSNLNPSTRYIQISFDYYGVTPYTRFCCSGTGLNGYLGVTSTDSTNDTYGWDTSYSPGSGDDWNNDASRMGYWQKISLIVALRGDKTPSNIWALYIYLDAATQGEGYFANMIFTEHSTYPTGPIRWTEGTRSPSQSVLDLTGVGTMSNLNVSFNSSSSIIFDGSSDYMSTNSVYTGTTSLTLETIFKTNSFSTGQNVIFNANGQGLYPRIGIRTDGLVYTQFRPSGVTRLVTNSSPLSTNTWYHLIFVYDQNSGAKMYINGQLDGTDGTTGNHERGTGHAIRIGNDTNLNHFMNGEIAVVKKYDRVLTENEIIGNYNKHKRQYGLT